MILKTTNKFQIFYRILLKQLVVNKPIFLKIAPNINNYLLQNIIDLSIKNNIDGLIISNTLPTDKGGLSGKPIENITTDMIKKVYKLSKGKLMIIGSGGIFSGEEI